MYHKIKLVQTISTHVLCTTCTTKWVQMIVENDTKTIFFNEDFHSFCGTYVFRTKNTGSLYQLDFVRKRNDLSPTKYRNTECAVQLYENAIFITVFAVYVWYKITIQNLYLQSWYKCYSNVLWKCIRLSKMSCFSRFSLENWYILGHIQHLHF